MQPDISLEDKKTIMSSVDPSESEQLLPNQRTKETRGFPFRVLFILGNEFCERYSFYGMRTILVLYLTYYINWSSDTSTAVYHAFNVLCYLFPLFGAILADGWWGKYRTIFWLSLVYAIGMILNTLGAINNLGNVTAHTALSCTGLIVIAIGTGGIKPCVAAFGGDQFHPSQEKYRTKFFSLFYFAINAGSLISTFLSPLIREKVKCFGTDCYALAFGIPAILMIIALVLFVAGTRWYFIYPPTGDIFTQVCRVIARAIKVRWYTPKASRVREHWLDYAVTESNKRLVQDIKYVLNVLVIFIPLPLFWTLFDQQGSRWTLQAVRMNGFVNSFQILPDQMQICNPLLILTLIPLTEGLIYPCLEKFKIPFRPLQRMTAGMILAGVSFIVAALVHMKIDVNLTPIPQLSSETTLRVINSADCPILIDSKVYPDWAVRFRNQTHTEGGLVVKPGQESKTAGRFTRPGKYKITFGCSGENSTQTASVDLQQLKAYDVIISRFNSSSLKYLFESHITKKSDDGKAVVAVIDTLNRKADLQVQCKNLIGGDMTNQVANMSSNKKTQLKSINQGDCEMSVTVNDVITKRNFSLKTGGIYTLVIRNNATTIGKTKTVVDYFTDVNPNDVSIFWMIPQYFLITLGEIFLSITGLSFAYSQAPPSMKSLLQSLWLLTVSVGNIVVLIVAEARFIDSQTDEYFLFAGLIGVATIIFMILAYRYKYVDESEFKSKENDKIDFIDNDD